MAIVGRLLRKFAHQYLLYWEKEGSDPSGLPTYKDPVEIKVRWQEQDKELLTPDNRTVLARGYILSSEQVKPGSLLLLGGTAAGSAFDAWRALASFPGVPTVNEGGLEVLRVNRTPDFKVKGTLYEVYT